jgi:uncharacterized protein (DUF488 family)
VCNLLQPNLEIGLAGAHALLGGDPSRAVVQVVGRLDAQRPGLVALMCAEREPAHCHRSYLADYLVGVRGVEVIHIRDATESAAHVRNPLCRVDGSRLVYDLGQRELF